MELKDVGKWKNGPVITKMKFIQFVTLIAVIFTPMVYLSFHETPVLTDKITIGTSRSFNMALLAIAEKTGEFNRQGLQVNIHYDSSAGAALDRMLRGGYDIAASAETPMVYRSFENTDFRIFATISTAFNDPKLIVRADSGILSPRDLVGRKTGCPTQGRSAHFFLHLFLLKHRITPESVEIVHASPQALIEKLVSGELSAAVMFEPHVIRCRQMLKENAKVFEEPGLYHKTANLAARTGFFEHRTGTAEKLINALIAAEKQLADTPEKIIPILADFYDTDIATIWKLLSDQRPGVELSEVLLMTMKDQGRWILSQNQVGKKQAPDFQKIVHTGILKAAAPSRVSIIQ